jgi:hypothetical protein
MTPLRATLRSLAGRVGTNEIRAYQVYLTNAPSAIDSRRMGHPGRARLRSTLDFQAVVRD